MSQNRRKMTSCSSLSKVVRGRQSEVTFARGVKLTVISVEEGFGTIHGPTRDKVFAAASAVIVASADTMFEGRVKFFQQQCRCTPL